MDDEDDYPGQILFMATINNNPELLKDLITKGDQKKHINNVDFLDRSLVFTAVTNRSLECLKVLLENGADPDLACSKLNGMTPLHQATIDGRADMVACLLEHKADINLLDNDRLTSLDLSLKNAHTKKCYQLLQNAKDNREGHISSALSEELSRIETCHIEKCDKFAAMLDENKVKAIVNAESPDDKLTVFMKACKTTRADVVNWLIDHGAEPNYDLSYNETPLHTACRQNKANHDTSEVVKVLLNNFPQFVSISTRDNNGFIHCLHLASDDCSVKILKIITKFKYTEDVLKWQTTADRRYAYRSPFDYNCRNISQYTPLHFAASRGNAQTVEHLLTLTVKGFRLENTFRELKGDEAWSKVEDYIIDRKKPIPIRPTDPNLVAVDNRSPLHLAIESGSSGITKILIDNGANVNLSFDYHMDGSIPMDKITPLVYAVNKGLEQDPNRSLEGDKMIVSQLLKAGAEDENKALAACSLQHDHQMTQHILIHRAKIDTSCKHIMYQSFAGELEMKPVEINWSKLTLSGKIMDEWLCESSLQFNQVMDRSLVMEAITRIDMTSCSLGEVPLSMFQLQSLHVLHLSDNRLRNLPRGDHWALPQLRELVLSKNKMEALTSQMFKLKSLDKLVVSENSLKSVSSAVWDAPCLKDLDLSHNQLTMLPTKRGTDSPDSIKRQFNVPGDPLQITDDVFNSERAYFDNPADTSSNGEDSKLNVEIRSRWSRTISVVPERYDDPDATLHHLNLSHNKFTSVPSGLACLAPKLHTLKLNNNDIKDMGAPSIYPVSLVNLDLSYNKIKIKTADTTDDYDPRLSLSDNCYNPFKLETEKKHKRVGSIGSSSIHDKKRTSTISMVSLGSSSSLCIHRPTRFEHLTDLNLSNNEIRSFTFGINETGFLPILEHAESDSVERGGGRPRPSDDNILFPELSVLNLSHNPLVSVSRDIGKQSQLAQINLSFTRITTLPSEMGLLRFWNLDLQACPLEDQLLTLRERNPRSAEYISFLKSKLDDSKPYGFMKLMIVGAANIGKTTLLNKLREETRTSRPFSHFTTRTDLGFAHSNVNGDTISTVGVDIANLVYDEKARDRRIDKRLEFRTWDFGGQEEYYATHQYFLTKRSLYLVVWNLKDGKTPESLSAALQNIQQWLVNIQTRAPNAPVLIVGTHSDMIPGRDRQRNEFINDLHEKIKDKFIRVADKPAAGLPDVLDSLHCNSGNRRNEINNLYYRLYDLAWEIKAPGNSTKALLSQEEPAIYIDLEKTVARIAERRKRDKLDPVLNSSEYRDMVLKGMPRKFRDDDELTQATQFLHDNGVLLHYKDEALRDLYFIDPQWLCDTLASVISVKSVNPFVKNGVMKIKDLHRLFPKSHTGQVTDIHAYIISLLSKFEMAITWDDNNLLIPSLLPEKYMPFLNDQQIPVCSSTPLHRKKTIMRSIKSLSGEVIPPSSRARLVKQHSSTFPRTRINPVARPVAREVGQSTFYNEPAVLPHAAEQEPEPEPEQTEPERNKLDMMIKSMSWESIRRLYLMAYIPSGFWPRLISHIYRDDAIGFLSKFIFEIPLEVQEQMDLKSDSSRAWKCWRTGLTLQYKSGDISCDLVKISQIMPQDPSKICENSTDPLGYHHNKMEVQPPDPEFPQLMQISKAAILEVEILNNDMEISVDEKKQKYKTRQDVRAKLLARVVDHIEALLADWFPDLGERFATNHQGALLVTRAVVCPACIKALPTYKQTVSPPRKEKPLPSRPPPAPLTYFLIPRMMADILHERKTICPAHSLANETEKPVESVDQPGELEMNRFAPDLLFLDIDSTLEPGDVSKYKQLGQGAFGVVFAGKLKVDNFRSIDVAVKSMQPVEPLPNSSESLKNDYEVKNKRWMKDANHGREAFNAYSNMRQEVNIMSNVKHNHVVSLLGVIVHPLSLVMDMAPLGDLIHILETYSNASMLLSPRLIQLTAIQVSSALEYLHSESIIYRDLKSDNILVWRIPLPNHPATHGQELVEVRLADLGISTSAPDSTGTKGNSGTPGYMAPEIIQHKGLEQYTGKIDCFSFGMLLYELVTLKRPYYNNNTVANPNSYILAGKLPTLTEQAAGYPSLILDLMALCWEMNPLKRPSAEQINRIASAPEFCTMQQAVGSETVLHVTCATLVPTGDPSYSTYELLICGGNRGKNAFEKFGKVEAFTYLFNGACSTSSSQSVPLPDECPLILACCAVNNHCWVADEAGYLHVYRLDTSGAHLVVSTSITNTSNIGTVKQMLYHPVLEAVFFLFEKGWLVEFDSKTRKRSNEKKFSEQPSYCCTFIGNRLWIGQRAGYITTLPIYAGGRNGAKHTVEQWMAGADCVPHEVNHFQPVEDYVVTNQICTDSTQHSVWSYVYPGSCVFRWDVATLSKQATKDISDIFPSNSKEDFGGSLPAARAQVSCLRATNHHLVVSTTWGCIITLNKTSLEALHCVRAHGSQPWFVPCILALPGDAERFISVGKGYVDEVTRVMGEQEMAGNGRSSTEKELWMICWKEFE